MMRKTKIKLCMLCTKTLLKNSTHHLGVDLGLNPVEIGENKVDQAKSTYHCNSKKEAKSQRRHKAGTWTRYSRYPIPDRYSRAQPSYIYLSHVQLIFEYSL